MMFDSIWDAIEREDTAYIMDYAASDGDMNAQKPFSGETLLQYAYQHHAKAAFLELLDQNANIEQELDDGTAITHRTVLDNDTWWLEQLISHGANVDAWSTGEGTRGGTPLHFAIVENKTRAAELLLRAGAEVDCPSNQFGSPTLYEASFQYRWEIVLLLLQHQGDAAYGPSGKTFLDSLKRRGYGVINNSRMEGFGDVIRFLKAKGYGEEVYEDCLWGEKKYDDYLNENNLRL